MSYVAITTTGQYLPDKNRSLGQAVCRNGCNILRFLTKMLWWLLKENAGILYFETDQGAVILSSHRFVTALSWSSPYIVTLSHPRFLILSSHSPVLIHTSFSSCSHILTYFHPHSHIVTPSTWCPHTRSYPYSYSHIRVSPPYPHLHNIMSSHPPILILQSLHPYVLRSQGPTEHSLWNAASYLVVNVGSIPGRVEPMNVTSCSRCKKSADESPTACKRLPAQE